MATAIDRILFYIKINIMIENEQFPMEGEGDDPDHLHTPDEDPFRIQELFDAFQECHPDLVWLRSKPCQALLQIPHVQGDNNTTNDPEDSGGNADDQSPGCSIIRVIFVAQTTEGQRLVFRLDEQMAHVEQMLLLPQQYVAIHPAMEVQLKQCLLDLKDHKIAVLKEKNDNLQQKLQSIRQFLRYAAYVSLMSILVSTASSCTSIYTIFFKRDPVPAVNPPDKHPHVDPDASKR